MGDVRLSSQVPRRLLVICLHNAEPIAVMPMTPEGGRAYH